MSNVRREIKKGIEQKAESKEKTKTEDRWQIEK